MFRPQVLKPAENTISIASALRIFAFLLLGILISGCAGNRFDVQDSATNAAPGTAQDFAVNVGDRIFFETDSTGLTARAKATLDLQAQWLNKYANYAITIEGHADERGTREYNLALGARRAAAAQAYLTSRGVNANRLRTISYGKERPVAVCNDISCWSQNRRAVTTLTGTGS